MSFGAIPYRAEVEGGRKPEGGKKKKNSHFRYSSSHIRLEKLQFSASFCREEPRGSCTSGGKKQYMTGASAAVASEEAAEATLFRQNWRSVFHFSR